MGLQEDEPKDASVVPRLWRSTQQKRPHSAESDADIRRSPDREGRDGASPSRIPKPHGSPIPSISKSPARKSPASKLRIAQEGLQDAERAPDLIKAHAGGPISDCRDSMCEATAVTSTFISLGDVLRGTPLSAAGSIPGQSSGAADPGAGARQRGATGEQQGAESASSVSPSGSRRTRSGYMPVKLQDLAQIGQQAGEHTGLILLHFHFMHICPVVVWDCEAHQLGDHAWTC